jgi:agarase
MEILGLGTAYARRDAITKPTTWTGFPNVFSPDFKRYCEKECERVCVPLRDDPWFVGYFIDNELEWHPWTGKGPFGDAFAKAEGHSAKTALVEFLAGKHSSPASFNAAWGMAISDFKELARMTELPSASTDAAKDDVREFVRLAAEKYFSIAVAAIRKHDPNHMIMGCRFAGQAP